MLKLVKVGDLWYMDYKGRLHSRTSPVEDAKMWDRVSELSSSDFKTLRKEFPQSLENFKIDVEKKKYVSGVKIKKTKTLHVAELLLDNPILGDKYVTYHATVVMKAKDELSKKTQTSKKLPAKKAGSKT